MSFVGLETEGGAMINDKPVATPSLWGHGVGCPRPIDIRKDCPTCCDARSHGVVCCLQTTAEGCPICAVHQQDLPDLLRRHGTGCPLAISVRSCCPACFPAMAWAVPLNWCHTSGRCCPPWCDALQAHGVGSLPAIGQQGFRPALSSLRAHGVGC